jgi:hypothetical protein
MKQELENYKSSPVVRVFRLVGTVALLAIASRSPDSSASDSKVHSASFCRVAPTGAAPAPVTDAQYKGPEIRNAGTAPMSVICPVVRDNTTNASSWDEMRIGLFDRSPVDDIVCTAYSRNVAGIQLFNGPFNTLGSSVQGWETVEAGDALSSMTDGYYHINCRIPSKFDCPECLCEGGLESCYSGLAFYRVQEP